MSNVLSVASVIEKNRLSSDVPFLIALDIDVINPNTGALVETLHVVNNTESISFRGFTYDAANFDVQLHSESGSQQTVRLSIKDYSKAIQARMQSYGGGIGFTVSLMVVNSAALGLPAEIQEVFLVIGAEAANYVCTFTLGAENSISKTFPRRRQNRDFCQWRYKSIECQYAGGLSTCDLTLNGANGCTVHANTIRFAAFPGISSRA